MLASEPFRTTFGQVMFLQNKLHGLRMLRPQHFVHRNAPRLLRANRFSRTNVFMSKTYAKGIFFHAQSAA